MLPLVLFPTLRLGNGPDVADSSEDGGRPGLEYCLHGLCEGGGLLAYRASVGTWGASLGSCPNRRRCHRISHCTGWFAGCRGWFWHAGDVVLDVVVLVHTVVDAQARIVAALCLQLARISSWLRHCFDRCVQTRQSRHGNSYFCLVLLPSLSFRFPADVAAAAATATAVAAVCTRAHKIDDKSVAGEVAKGSGRCRPRSPWRSSSTRTASK